MYQWQIGFLAGCFRTLCGVQCIDASTLPKGPLIFYANHTSHMDFTVIWSVLPPKLRQTARPVAARDYWIRNSARRRVADKVFNALLIERKKITRENNPLLDMEKALQGGYSLIVFPEGTRGMSSVPGEFKPGLFHLHQACPEVPLIPVYLDNLNRMLPRGTFLPIPLITRITFGQPLEIHSAEREAFLAASREAILNLIPK